MGLFDSLFARAAAGLVRESKAQQKKTQTIVSVLNELNAYQRSLNDFLSEKDVRCVYGYDSNVFSKGQAAVQEEKRKMDRFRAKVQQYLDLGGLPYLITDCSVIDKYLRNIKILKEKGFLDDQMFYLDDETEEMTKRLDSELEMKHMMDDYHQAEIDHMSATLDELKKGIQLLSMLRDAQQAGADFENMSGTDFENICLVLVQSMGFTANTTKASGDGGIDIVAYNNQPLVSGKYIIQCKRYSGSVGEPIIRDLYGVVMSERANKGILMTSGYFSAPAMAFAEDKPIELIDGAKMKELMQTYGVIKQDN